MRAPGYRVSLAALVLATFFLVLFGSEISVFERGRPEYQAGPTFDREGDVVFEPPQKKNPIVEGNTFAPTPPPAVQATRAPSDQATRAPSGRATQAPSLETTSKPTALGTSTERPTLLKALSLSPTPAKTPAPVPQPTEPPLMAAQTQECLESAQESVWYLIDRVWGQTCNTFHLLATSVGHARHALNGRMSVAIGQQTSKYILASGVDLSYFTSHGVSLFLGCKPTNGSIPPLCLKCTHWFNKGKMMKSDSTPNVFHARVQDSTELVQIWYERSGVKGFQTELTWLRPAPEVISEVEAAMKPLHMTGKPLVGLHKRSMDGLCYRWMTLVGTIQKRGLLECHSQSSAVQRAGLSIPYIGRHPGNIKCAGMPNLAHRMNETHRACFEAADAGTNICDVRLTPTQVEYFTNVSRGRFPLRNVTLFVASDRQLPRSDVELKAEVSAEDLRTLDGENLALYSGLKQNGTLMLAEMWALSLTDHFFTMPFSTCDSIIVHWWIALRKKPVEAIFPPNCWEFYADDYQKQKQHGKK